MLIPSHILSFLSFRRGMGCISTFDCLDCVVLVDPGANCVLQVDPKTPKPQTICTRARSIITKFAWINVVSTYHQLEKFLC